jgi:hypothetical protein
MLKLFRNIRKKLLQEGKTANYMKYAIGEIFLVVIGILIALNINNWNTGKSDRKIEKEYISSLIEDLATDTLNLSQLIKSYEKKIIKIDTVLSMFPKITEGYNDTLHRNLPEVISFLDFIYTDRTIQQLKNTGTMRLISNKEVANAIIEYDLSVRKLLESYYPDLLFYYEESNKSWFEIMDVSGFENDRKTKSADKIEKENKNYLLKTDAPSLGKFNNIIRNFQNDLRIIKNYDIELMKKATQLLYLLKNEYQL